MASKTSVCNIRRVNGQKVEWDIYIGRPYKNLNGSKWSNPFTAEDIPDAGLRAAKYEQYLFNRPSLLKHIPELVGKKLSCWTAPEPCHGDILAELANLYAEAYEQVKKKRAAELKATPQDLEQLLDGNNSVKHQCVELAIKAACDAYHKKREPAQAFRNLVKKAQDQLCCPPVNNEEDISDQPQGYINEGEDFIPLSGTVAKKPALRRSTVNKRPASLPVVNLQDQSTPPKKKKFILYDGNSAGNIPEIDYTN